MSTQRMGQASLAIDRVFEPSAIRRGRLATSPTFFVWTPDGARWKFMRKKDAKAFADRGGTCPAVLHGHGWCEFCRGYLTEKPPAALDAEGHCTEPGCYFCRGSGDWTRCPNVRAHDAMRTRAAEKGGEGG